MPTVVERSVCNGINAVEVEIRHTQTDDHFKYSRTMTKWRVELLIL